MLWLMVSSSQPGCVRLCVEADKGAVLRMRIDGHVTSMEGLEGRFVSGKTIDYCIVNPVITIHGNIQCIQFFKHPYNTWIASIVELNVSHCPELQKLECRWNQLKSLDVSQCPKLQKLKCWRNQLQSLGMSKCTALQHLECGKNQLQSLGMSQCLALQKLNCGANQLKSLDVSKCTALQHLECYKNQLQDLDVSQCLALQELNCRGNQLQSLDVSGCPKLQELNCLANPLDDSAVIALVESLPMDPERSERRIFIGSRIPAVKSWAQLKGWKVN